MNEIRTHPIEMFGVSSVLAMQAPSCFGFLVKYFRVVITFLNCEKRVLQ